jgi:hypothetical protein
MIERVLELKDQLLRSNFASVLFDFDRPQAVA